MILIGIIIVLVFVLFRQVIFSKLPSINSSVYAFDGNEELSESGGINDATSTYGWWVNSGAYMKIASGTGKTVQGNLAASDPWRLAYAKSNPTDTDNGFHPQNIFRLILKSNWTDFEEEAYFNIETLQLSQSPNRNESNGILLFGRYVDENNLYYVGLRVDGNAVVKKKRNGEYFVLKEIPIIPNKPYNRNTNPNVLPKNTWIGLRTEFKTDTAGVLHITLWTDIGKTGDWRLAATAVDDGVSSGPVITGPAHVGIRTDFMDVSFTDFQIQEIK